MYSAIIDAPFGVLGIRTDHGVLTLIDFLPASQSREPPSDPFTARVVAQLTDYFHNPHHGFSLDLALRGTPFQQQVWEALLDIPSGTRVTYGELAHRLGTSARAVGGACRANPIPIVVPCHRVVAKDGLGGYAGDARRGWGAIKAWLLEHESGVPISPGAALLRPQSAMGNAEWSGRATPEMTPASPPE